MKQKYIMKPQDMVILLKLIALRDEAWNQVSLAGSLGMSQSEISQSLQRLKFAGLLDERGKNVMRQSLMDLLQYGLAYIFPQRPGATVRGIPTAHSAPPLNSEIVSEELYVWPSAFGTVRGHGIVPLFPSAPGAALRDEKLYELLALADALRVGKVREKNLAIKELKARILKNGNAK